MPSDPDYCPFCGARLSMDESIDDHFEAHDDCAASFTQWKPGGSSASVLGSPSGTQRVIVWVLIAVLMLYALVIQGSILLGVIASAIVFIASRINWASLA